MEKKSWWCKWKAVEIKMDTRERTTKFDRSDVQRNVIKLPELLNLAFIILAIYIKNWIKTQLEPIIGDQSIRIQNKRKHNRSNIYPEWNTRRKLTKYEHGKIERSERKKKSRYIHGVARIYIFRKQIYENART